LLMPARCSFRTWSAWSPAVVVLQKSVDGGTGR
jgi:hypothetical protein